MEDNADFDVVPDVNERQEIAPYQFEPQPVVLARESDASDSSEGEDEIEDQVPVDADELVGRVGNTNWCLCGNCVPMGSEHESVCCQEIHGYSYRLEEEDVQCITQHPGFDANCTNPWVLELSFWEYLQNNGPIGDEEPRHETYRYIAYRRLSRFIYQRLPKHDRRVHPACTVAKIRVAFPDQNYAGFQYA